MEGKQTPIAIIGMSCRFPGGATTPDKFWDLLSTGENAWSKVPADRFDQDTFHHSNPENDGTTSSYGGHFLDGDVSTFDPAFFGISPKEATSMDPQHRLQLEISYEAFEAAGLSLDEIRGSNTSVYIATFTHDYEVMQLRDTSQMAKYTMTGIGQAIAANRISYLFDLRGPSMTLDTGCSGSMVGLHQACQSLRCGESDMSLVGATNLILGPEISSAMSNIHVLNKNGRCYPFDTRGEGYGRGEGSAAIVLKRLDDALRDGDNIRGIIRGTGVNQDGKTDGITLPSAKAQEALIRKVYQASGLAFEDTSYVEAHGTGTLAGDKEELTAIKNVFSNSFSNPDETLYVGSVKGNIGHLENASGIAGVIKSVLMLERGQIVPTANLIKLKPELQLESTRINIPTTTQNWQPPRGIRRISVNGFGYGGTNAHAVLECYQQSMDTASATPEVSTICELPAVTLNLPAALPSPDFSSHHSSSTDSESGDSFRLTAEPSTGMLTPLSTYSHDPMASPTTSQSTAQLFTFSAKSEKSLSAMITNMVDWISRHPASNHILPDIAHTLSRRTRMQWRRTAAASSLEDLADILFKSQRATKIPSAPIRINYIFTGQGAQWHAMGRELIHTDTVFASSIRRSAEILTSYGAHWSLLSELSCSETESRLNDSHYGQPASTAIQIALVDYLYSLGVVPKAVIGHSSGEIAAAYACGALSHESALLVSYQRSFLGNKSKEMMTEKGSMMAAGTGKDELYERFGTYFEDNSIVVACINSGSSVTISGDESGIRKLKAALSNEGVFARQLKVDTAYHSHHMQAVAPDYLESLKTLRVSHPNPAIPFFSSVSGEAKTSGFGPQYWVDNLVSPVNFEGALQALVRSQQVASDRTISIFVELGPHAALAGPTRQILQAVSQPLEYQYISCLVRSKDAAVTVLDVVGSLFEYGCPVNVSKANLISRMGYREILSDLPAYPWDHSNKFWHESRTSKETRLRTKSQHDLLGIRMPGSSTSQPSWKYHVNFKNLPWIQDHDVDGSAVFPASSYMCMAIEAMTQLHQSSNSNKTISKIVLTNVSFLEMLNWAQPDETVELQLNFGALSSDVQTKSSTTRSFVISSATNTGTWSEKCKGTVSLEYESVIDEVEGAREADLFIDSHLSLLHDIESNCTSTLDSATIYEELRSHGNFYGTSFALIKEMQLSTEQTVSKISISDIAQVMPGKQQKPHTIHPTTLDAFIHSTLPSYFRQCTAESVVTASVGELTIFPGIFSSPGQELITATTVQAESDSNAKTQISIFQTGEDSQLQFTAQMKDVVLKGVGGSSSAQQGDSSREMSYTINWQQDLDQVMLPIQPDNAVAGELDQEAKVLLLDTAAAIYIKDTLAILPIEEVGVANPENVFFYQWMRRWIESDYAQSLISGMSDTAQKELLQVSKITGVEGQMLYQVCTEFVPILKGEIDAITVMLKDDLLYKLYADDASSRCYAHLTTFLKSLTFKNPNLKALEIGGGTAGATLPLLSALATETGSVPLEKYCFTDVSAGFFEKAREKLIDYTQVLDFKSLDIGKHPREQGFEVGSYDIVIASNVLHVPQDIDQTLAYARALLKPGGRLCMIETIRVVPFLNALCGVLPGWWIGVEHGRPDSPLLTADEWQLHLRKAGFSGYEKIGYDFNGTAQRSAMLVSRAIGTEQHLPERSIEIIPSVAADKSYSSLVSSLTTELSSETTSVTVGTWPLKKISDDTTYIIVDDGEQALLDQPEEDTFSSLISLMTTGNQVYWVSLSKEESTNSRRSLFIGFARAARIENKQLKLVTLDARVRRDDNNLAQLIKQTFNKSFKSQEFDSIEMEYLYQNGTLSIPRLVPNTGINQQVRSQGCAPEPKLSLFRQPNVPLKLHVQTPGLLDSMRWIQNASLEEPIGADEVEVEVQACGLNFKDVFLALGSLAPSVGMAGEYAGVITRVGSNFEKTHHVGDRVCGWGSSPYANIARVNGNMAQHIPSWMPFTNAASIPVVYGTAYHCLVEVARLERGQSVLIHAASGGVGQAAVCIAQHIGAKVFATVGSKAKKDLLVERFGIPEDHIFSNRISGFKLGIQRLTNGQGVDVVLNSLSGQALRDSWSCVAPFGTFVEIGKTNIHANSDLNMAPFDKNITFAAVDLALLGRLRPQKAGGIIKKVLGCFDNGIYKTVDPVTVMPISDIAEAFRLVQARKHVGKIVLEAKEDSLVQAVIKEAPLSLSKDGTYIIAGGLGGVGYETGKWLAEHGAGHVVLLSRRSLTAEQQQAMQTDFAAYTDAEVHAVQCDITSSVDVAKLASVDLQGLPPVRGIIQSAMVLKDTPLEKMTAADYSIPLKTKVDGTNNLIQSFSGPDLSHFIMLSSVVSVTGNASQANYAAGNAYLDALAHDNAHSGTHFMSLNLGPMRDVGVVANNAALERYLVRQGYIPVRMSELFIMLNYTLNGQAKAAGVNQLAIGFNTASLSGSDNEEVLSNPMFSHLLRAGSASEETTTTKRSVAQVSVQEQLSAITEPAEKIKLAATLMAGKVASLLALDAEKVEMEIPLMDLGLDSLVTTELKNWIVQKIGAPITLGELVGAAGLSDLAATAVGKISS